MYALPLNIEAIGSISTDTKTTRRKRKKHMTFVLTYDNRTIASTDTNSWELSIRFGHIDFSKKKNHRLWALPIMAYVQCSSYMCLIKQIGQQMILKRTKGNAFSMRQSKWKNTESQTKLDGCWLLVQCILHILIHRRNLNAPMSSPFPYQWMVFLLKSITIGIYKLNISLFENGLFERVP